MYGIAPTLEVILESRRQHLTDKQVQVFVRGCKTIDHLKGEIQPNFGKRRPKQGCDRLQRNQLGRSRICGAPFLHAWDAFSIAEKRPFRICSYSALVGISCCVDKFRLVVGGAGGPAYKDALARDGISNVEYPD